MVIARGLRLWSMNFVPWQKSEEDPTNICTFSPREARIKKLQEKMGGEKLFVLLSEGFHL